MQEKACAEEHCLRYEDEVVNTGCLIFRSLYKQTKETKL